MKLDNLKFQIKHTTGNMLTANQQRPYQHCPQVKSHLSGSSSSPGYSQLMAEPSNSGGIQDPENFPSTKVKGHVLAPPRINLGELSRSQGGRGGCARVIKRHVTTLTSASYCIENSTEFNFCATFSNLLWNAV